VRILAVGILACRSASQWKCLVMGNMSCLGAHVRELGVVLSTAAKQLNGVSDQGYLGLNKWRLFWVMGWR